SVLESDGVCMSITPFAMCAPRSRRVNKAWELLRMVNCQVADPLEVLISAVPRPADPMALVPVKVRLWLAVPASVTSSNPVVICPLPSAVKLPAAMIEEKLEFCPEKEKAY